MSIIDNFKKYFKRSKYVIKDGSVPFDINTWNYRKFDGNLLTMDLIVANIDALARNIAKIELRSIQRKENGIAIVDYKSDVARALKKPNQFMSRYDFLYKVAALYYLTNNAFIYPEYDSSGNLVALWPINYQSFNLVKSPKGNIIAKFRLNYFKEYSCPYDCLIHLRNHFISDELFGETNVSLNPVAELINAQNQGIINGIKNSAIIRGILKATGVIKDADLEKAKKQFIKDNFNASNNGGVITIDGKFDYQNIDSKPYMINPQTMEETKKMVFNYFGTNEDFLQNKFTSEGYEAVYEGKLEPFAIMLTEALTNGLFTDRELGFGNEIEANMAKLKYQPMTVITQIILATNQLGLFKRDEYREMLGYPPLGPENGGDDIMIALNNYSKDGGNNNE